MFMPGIERSLKTNAPRTVHQAVAQAERMRIVRALRDAGTVPSYQKPKWAHGVSRTALLGLAIALQKDEVQE